MEEGSGEGEKVFWTCENKKREGAGGKTGISAGTIENTGGILAPAMWLLVSPVSSSGA